jgi:predicted dehydrogenase
MGVQHLDAWHKLGVPIGGLYARNVERGRAVAEPYGCPVYDSVASSRIEGGWVESGGLQTTVEIDGSRGRLEIAPDGPLPFVDLPQEDPYVAQLRHFRDSLANDTPFLVTREEVLGVMRVVSAARESAESGRSVVLSPE